MVVIKEPLFISNSQQQKDARAPQHIMSFHPSAPHARLVSSTARPGKESERARVCGTPIVRG
jgi:hypothetical protein